MKATYLLMLLLSVCQLCFAQNLRIVTEEYPPYQTVENGKLVSGTSYNLVKEMLKRSHLKSRIELLPWARAYTVATTEDNVLIFSMARSEERENLFHWLYRFEALTYNFYALSERQDLQVKELSDILGHTIVAVRDSFEANSLLNMGFVENKNLILTVNYKEAWQMLMLKRAELTYANQLFEDEIFQTNVGEQTLFSKIFNLGETSELYIAASANTDESILSKLKKSLTSMEQDGTIAKLRKHGK
jgi:polar amino acid transport system substrate-binding protein